MTLRPPGQAENLRRAMDAAYRILSIRSRSEEELREKLKHRGFRESLINQVVSSLKEEGYVNDAEFSLNFARHLLRTHYYGLFRIAEELKKKGVPSETVKNTVNRLKGEIDEREMVIHSLRGRLQRSDYTRIEEKEKKRVIQYLYRRGFPLSTIYEVLKGGEQNSIEDDRE